MDGWGCNMEQLISYLDGVNLHGNKTTGVHGVVRVHFVHGQLSSIDLALSKKLAKTLVTLFIL
jgi:hypothetical protein